jgi:hypothetical protein
MDDPLRTEPPDPDDDLENDLDDADRDGGRGGRPDRPPVRLDGLSIAGITKRRVAWLLGAVVVAWIVIVFARQMGDAASIAGEADRARVDNATAAADVAELQRELDLVQRQAYVEQQARGIGLGGPKDHAVISPDASPLPDTAPGSAAVRLRRPAGRPLRARLVALLLFGPTPGG